MRRLTASVTILLLPLFVLSQQLHQPYRYPVKRGSPAWDSLKTYAEKRAAAQIPPDVVRKLTTSALLESVLDYPLIGDVFVFNSLQTGIDKLSVNFAAFKELLARKDLPAVAVARYRQFGIDSIRTLPSAYAKGEYSVKMSFLEALLAQPQVSGQLNNAEKANLLRRLIANYDGKGKQRDDYGGLSLGSNAWPVYHLNRQLAGDTKVASSDSALYKGILLDSGPWIDVMKEARKKLQ